MSSIPRGRPRDPAIDARLLNATRELLLQQGYADLSMEAVAAWAGVGKPSLYRRYATKAALVFEAVFGRSKANADPDTGDVVSDLKLAYAWAVEEFAAPEARAALPGLVADITSRPEVAAQVRAGVIEPEYARVRQALERAQRRGQVRGDVDLTLVIDVFTGAALARATLVDHVVDAKFGDDLVDLVMQGLAPRATG